MAIQESVDAFDLLIDRIDVDPIGFAEDEEELSELMNDLGAIAGTECASEGLSRVFSDLVVYFADQATMREVGTQAFINGMLSALCSSDLDFEVELTLQGRAACVGS